MEGKEGLGCMEGGGEGRLRGEGRFASLALGGWMPCHLEMGTDTTVYRFACYQLNLTELEAREKVQRSQL